MNFRLSVAIFVLLSPIVRGVDLPKNEKFFETEKLVKTYSVQGAQVRMLSTAKDFKTLGDELKVLLGEGWITENPKKIKQPENAKKNGAEINLETLVIYVHPEDPNLRVSLALTKLPGTEAGHSLAILTIARNFLKR